MSLSGRTALVTGGASGMGMATAFRLAEDGASIAVVDIDGAAAETVAKQLRERDTDALAVEADISVRAQVDEAVQMVRGELGPIHVLTNNAGVGAFAPFTAITPEAWERQLAINLTGTFNCTQAVVGDMIDSGWGRIVNIASYAGQSGAAHMAHYSASKAGVLGFTKALAQELGGKGITVNAIAPGAINTPMLQAMMTGALGETSAGDEGGGASPGAIMPIPRIGEPEEIAATVAFLVSEVAGYITGQVLGVNGGLYM